MRLARSWLLLWTCSLGLAVAGCECGGGGSTGRRDSGPRRDVGGGLDSGGGGDLDAWLDPDLDADLDAGFDPFLVDAGLYDTNLDVGPIDAYRVPVADTGGSSSRRDSGAYDTNPDVRLPSGGCGILWSRGDPLPDVCLPRCSTATRDLFEACFGDPVCEAVATDADRTRIGIVWLWEEETTSEVDCASCIGTQRFSCWHEPCPSQSEAWVDCLATRGADACDHQRTSLDHCLAPHTETLEPCLAARVADCFPAH